jgi:hypothetical protein
MRTGDPDFCFKNFLQCTAIFPLVLLLGYNAQASRLGQEDSSPIEREVHVHGIVLNVLTDKPIGRALVTAMDAATMTNGDGRFDFDLRLPAGSPVGGFILPSARLLERCGRRGFGWRPARGPTFRLANTLHFSPQF